MAYTISKKVVTNYTITKLLVEFTTNVKQYIAIRNKFSKNKMINCFDCKYKFRDTEQSIGLAFTNKGNIVLCNFCSYKIANLNDPDIEVIQKLSGALHYDKVDN